MELQLHHWWRDLT
jgi:hypothetical protein